MSRSRRRSLWVKDRNNRYMKRLGNKRVRKADIDYLSSKGSSYKRLLSSWDICDYKTRWTLDDAVETYNRRVKENDSWFIKEYPTLDDFLRYYRKCVIYK